MVGSQYLFSNIFFSDWESLHLHLIDMMIIIMSIATNMENKWIEKRKK